MPRKKQKKNSMGFWLAYAMECIASAALGIQASNKLFAKTAKPSQLETEVQSVQISREVNEHNTLKYTITESNASEPNYVDINDLEIKASESNDELKTEIKDGKLFYAIQKGDVFEKIEVRGNLVRGLIQKLNPKVNPRKLQIGQKIVIGYEGKPDFGKKRNLFPDDADYVLLARMLFGEARGCSEFERAQIGYSAINKINDGVEWNGRTLREVLNCEEIYDCFGSNDINWPFVSNPEKHDKKAWEKCLRVAKGVINREYEDKTKGATHYYNPSISAPYWAHGNEFRNLGRLQETKDTKTQHTFCIKN